MGEINTDNLLADLDDLDNILESMAFGSDKKVYIICEKKSFRSESLNNALTEEYKTKMFYVSSDVLHDFPDPLCFVMEITAASLEKMFKRAISHIQDIAIKENVPIFLIGESEDLANINHAFNDNDVRIIRFKRPIDLKTLVADITSALMTSNMIDKKKHILVVDDSITFLKLLKRTLETRFRVTTASSGFEAIEQLSKMRENPPDLILLDYLMPILSGSVLCEMIKQEKDFKEVPIVFLSSNENTSDIISVMPNIDGYRLKNRPTDDLGDYLDLVITKRKRELAKK